MRTCVSVVRHVLEAIRLQPMKVVQDILQNFLSTRMALLIPNTTDVFSPANMI